MIQKNNILKDFYILADYLEKEGKIKNANEYKKYFPAFLLHAQHLKSYNFAIPYCKNKKILDIGCFIGYGETHIAQYAKKIIAIDNDKKAINFARKNRIVLNVKFEETDVKKLLPFSNETFDTIIAFEVIEHIPLGEVNNFLYETKRVLKKGGTLLITTPNSKFRLLPFQKPFNPEHYQEFTIKKISKVLGNIFEDIQIKGIKAKKWIEKIEKKRVRTSPCRFYVYKPLHKFLNKILLTKIKNLIKKIKYKIIKSFIPKNSMISRDDKYRFNNLFQKFSTNDFYLEHQMLNKSMNLFVICRK